MKKILTGILLIILCSNSHFSSAQLMFKLPDSYISFEPIGTDLTLKTAKLPNGVNLQYAEQGSFTGTPVIFLHGITDSWHSFESVLALLPYTIHAFAISQRGHGDSDRPLSGYTPKDFASDVAAFIKLHDLKSAFIVGHSMGGVVAQQFVLDHPQLVKGIVIVDSDPSMKNNPGMPEFFQEVSKLEGAINKEFMDEFQKSTLAKTIDSVYYNTLVAEGLKVPASVFKAAFKGLMEVDYTNELKKIDRPVLILWGDKDAFCLRKGQEIFIKEIKNAKLLIYEGTGHALHWEEPVRFTTDLLDFINKFI